MIKGQHEDTEAPCSSAVAAVDLFCGAGGKTHGFIRAGIRVTAGVDIDPTCRYAYEANNPGADFINQSVDQLDPMLLASLFPPGSKRVLIGCAPCQPFSTYSYRYRAARRSPRWSLLQTFGELVHQIKPDIVTAENVPELALLNHGAYARFIADLRTLGYHITSRIVRCADYGVPQTRQRLVVMASLHGPIDLIPPTHTPATYVTVRRAIGMLPPIAAGGPPPVHDPLHRSSHLSTLNLQRIRATPEGGDWRDWPRRLRLACHEKESGKTYPSVYGRMRWEDLAPTITTQCYGLGNGRFGHPTQDRAMSLREAALLQTFPASYAFVEPGQAVTFKHTGRHIGNAVPVALGEAIARSITSHLRSVSDATRRGTGVAGRTPRRSRSGAPGTARQTPPNAGDR